jgi:hypothetical protein
MTKTSRTTPAGRGNPIRAWFSRHATALFVGGFGVAFATAGIVILTVALPAARARAGAAASLPVVTIAGASEHPAGTRVLLEARIATDAPTPYGQFVAFRRQEFRGWKEENGRRTEQWTTKEVVVPPLALGEPGATLQVVNSGYAMELEPHTWQSTGSLEHSLLGESTQRLTGFHRGDRVTVEGVLGDSGAGRAIEAAVLAGGTRADYVASLEGAVPTLTIVGWIFTGVGALMAVLGLVVARRSN